MNAAAATSAWLAGLDALPLHHHRRWGLRLLALGATSMLLTMLATPPWASLGLAVALSGALLCRAPLHRLPWMWLGLAYGAWIAASTLSAWAQDAPGAQARLPGATWTWLATPVVALGLAADGVRRWAWRGVALMSAAAAVIAIIQFTVGLGDGPLRIDAGGTRWQVARGFSEHHLTFGLAAALLVVAAAQRGVVWNAGPAAVWCQRTAACVALLVCGSRAALLAAILGLWATISARGRTWTLIGLGIAILAGGMVAARFAFTDANRLAKIARMENGRWPIWRTSLHIADDHPVMGCGGKDAFKLAYRDAFPVVNPGKTSEFPDGAPHAHNAALSLITEYGTPALLLHLAFWTTALTWLWRRRHDTPDGWRLGVGVAVVASVGGIFEPYPTRAVQGVAIHACLGLALALALRPVPAETGNHA